MRRARAAGAALAAALATASAAAEEPVYVLPDVVVTPTRVPMPAEQASSTVTVITGEEIERRQQRDIVEVLREVPGLSVVQSGGPGSQTSIFTRGAESNHTVVLVDGIQVSDPSITNNAFDFAHLTTDLVERIEVVRGPPATIYGADAIGGVINIITRRGEGPPSVYGELEAGSFGTFNQRAGLSGGTDLYDYSLGVSHNKTDGISVTPKRLRPRAAVADDDDGYTNLTGQVRVGLRPVDGLELSAYARRIQARQDNDLSFNDPNSESLILQTFGRIEASAELFDGAVDTHLGYAVTVHDRKTTDAPDADNPVEVANSQDEGRRTVIDWQGTVRAIPNNTLTMGVEYEREKITSTNFLFDTGLLLNSVAQADDKVIAGYLQDTVAVGDHLFVTGGVRWDAHKGFGLQTTWRAGLTYLLEETGTRLRASYATGFSAPSLFERFGQRQTTFFGFTFPFNGNPALAPEESRAWEAGFDQTLCDGAFSFGAVYFETDIDNLITTSADFTTTINLGKAEARGVESFVALRPVDWMELHLDHSYVRAEDASNRQELLRRPRHKAGLTVTVMPMEGASVGLDAVYVGERADIAIVSGERIYTGSYTVVNLAGSYQLGERVRLFARIDNLFDRDYEDPDGFAHPGLSAFAGLRLTM
jgi:vitamin B12 transporter